MDTAGWHNIIILYPPAAAEAKAWCGPNIDEKYRREELIKIF